MKKGMNNVFKVTMLAMLALALVISGCSGANNNNSSGSNGNATPAPNNGSNGQTAEAPAGQDGQITATPITFTAIMTSGVAIDYNESPYYQALAELTNVTLDIQMVPISNRDRINLMFASRNYPDLLLRTDATDKQMMDAVAAGDLVPLTALIEEHAPNWARILDEQPEVRKAITFPDGEIYSLPTIIQLPVQVGIRDQWLINKNWLDQLGLDVPTTTDEFEAALQAFKDNAGQGDIPENVIPWYFRFNEYVGGQMDLYGGSFGVLAPDTNHLAVIDGKVQFQAMNPEIKEPLAFLNRLYTKGLIPSEAFTDDWAAFSSKLRSEPAVVGSISAFINSNPEFVPMLPPKAPGVSQQMYRQQTGFVAKNRFAITRNNPDPVAAIKLADVMAEPDWTVQDWYGMFGDKFVQQDGDNYFVLPVDPSEQDFPNIDGLAAITPSVAERIQYHPETTYYSRAEAVEMYQPVIAPIESFYPDLMFMPDESDRLASLRTDINAYVQETFARWITRGGMENEWDDYIRNLQNMQVDSMIELLQTALDRYNNS